MYVVYFTMYKGNKLPPFYIGSTKIQNIKNGYIGSVTSGMYKDTWTKEKNNKPNLFSVKIISYHKSGLEAKQKEEKLQRRLNVIDNSLYINRGYAFGPISDNYQWYNNGKVEAYFCEKDIIPNEFVKGRLYKRKPKSGFIIFNNGTKEIHVYNDQPIPNGYTKGRIKGKLKGYLWYHKNNEHRLFSPHDIIPKGWKRGMSKTSTMAKIDPKATKDTIWYNNGVKNKRIKKNQPIPDGYVKGFKKNVNINPSMDGNS